MCKVGDIILVEGYTDNGIQLDKHSFVVIDDRDGKIEGMSYDMICNVLSSFKNEAQRERKLSYPGNFPIAHDDTVTNPHNNKDGYIKTDQLYFFNKNKINYHVIGNVNPDVMDLIFDFIENGDFQIVTITDNL